MKNFAIMCLGCKVNDYEATYLRNQLLKEYNEVSFKDIADIYIIYTCCVTNIAEAKTRKMIHRARRQNPDAYVVAVGCLSQIKGNENDFDDVDLVIGSSEKDKIFAYIQEGLQKKIINDPTTFVFEHLDVNDYPLKSRAFIKIEDGCNQFCAYCVIPYTRGRERSGDHNKILKQAKTLAENYPEIVLTGIHTGRYHDGDYNLYALLKDLLKIKKLQTIRLSSIEVTELTDDIIELMKDNPRIAHHLHIPVQSASNTILKAMDRPYTIEEYLDRINYIRNKLPDVSISTDLIVGFPGESEELFAETLVNLEKINFSFIHVFPYARKEGTKANGFEGHMNNAIKKERVNIVLEQQAKRTLAFNNKFIGKKAKLLVEKIDGEYAYGYIRQYIYVKVKAFLKVGEFVDIIIDQVNNKDVIGHVA